METGSIRQLPATPMAPAPSSAQPHLLGRLLHAVQQLWTDFRVRRQLEQLPDSMLSDIGLSRADVTRETLRPFWSPIDYELLDTQRRRSARKSYKH